MPACFKAIFILAAVSISISASFSQETAKLAATVQTPSGMPASKARVAQLVAGSKLLLRNGEIRIPQPECAVQEADEAGRVQLPETTKPFRMVITHPEGYALFDGHPESFSGKITLLPWSRVQGIFHIGSEPARKAPLTLERSDLFHQVDGLPNVFVPNSVTTDDEGHFVFDRVFPGTGRVCHNMWQIVDAQDRQAVAASEIAVEVLSGKTNTFQIGGKGRAVIAQIEPPEALRENIDLSFAVVQVNIRYPLLPMLKPAPIPEAIKNLPVESDAWMQRWEQTDEGKKWTALKLAHGARKEQMISAPNYWATADRQGKFRLEDLPAGDYIMNIQFKGDDAPDCTLSNFRFAIPPFEGARKDEPLDLGVLPLK